MSIRIACFVWFRTQNLVRVCPFDDQEASFLISCWKVSDSRQDLV